MVRVVQTEQVEIDTEFINLPDESGRSVRETVPRPGQGLIGVVALSLGVLCLLQAALNVSLRLVLNTPDKQTLDRGTSCKNVTQAADKWTTLADQYFKQGWVNFQLSFYYISLTKKTWRESREDCLQRGADLVVINSQEEAAFTTSQSFYKQTWVGLYNNTETRQWTWVDGTQLTKSYWSPGEPNRYQGRNEDCVEIRSYFIENSWNDEECETPDFWICEKNLAP